MLADTPIGSRLIVIDRAVYADHMEGFWLGANIGNWTGRITEMDKIGGEGYMEIFTRVKTGASLIFPAFGVRVSQVIFRQSLILCCLRLARSGV